MELGKPHPNQNGQVDTDIIPYMVDRDNINVNIGENASVNVNDGKVFC